LFLTGIYMISLHYIHTHYNIYIYILYYIIIYIYTRIMFNMSQLPGAARQHPRLLPHSASPGRWRWRRGRSGERLRRQGRRLPKRLLEETTRSLGVIQWSVEFHQIYPGLNWIILGGSSKAWWLVRCFYMVVECWCLMSPKHSVNPKIIGVYLWSRLNHHDSRA